MPLLKYLNAKAEIFKFKNHSVGNFISSQLPLFIKKFRYKTNNGKYTMTREKNDGHLRLN